MMSSKPRQPDVHMSEANHYAFLHEVGLCILTARKGRLEVEHIRGTEPLMGKTNPSMNAKPHFSWCVPLLAEIHQRRTNESGDEAMYREYGMDLRDCEAGPLVMAGALFAFSCRDDVEGARQYIRSAQLHRTARLAKRAPDKQDLSRLMAQMDCQNAVAFTFDHGGMSCFDGLAPDFACEAVQLINSWHLKVHHGAPATEAQKQRMN